MINRRHTFSRTVDMLVNAQIMRLECEQALEREHRELAQGRRTARPEQRRPDSDRPTPG